MKNADESWEFRASFPPPVRSSFFLSSLLAPATSASRHPSSRGSSRRGRVTGERREFTGRSKSFARKAKTLANGCFSWAEYLKKREGAEEDGGRGRGREGVAAVGSAKRRK